MSHLSRCLEDNVCVSVFWLFSFLLMHTSLFGPLKHRRFLCQTHMYASVFTLTLQLAGTDIHLLQISCPNMYAFA